MNKKEQKWTTDQIIEKKLSEVIKENLDSIPEVHISPEELIALAETDKMKKRKRFVK